MKILIAISLLISTLFAELQVGETFPSLKLVDQYNIKKEVKTKGSTTLILSFEKDVSAKIKSYMDTKEKDFLTHNNMMYISDISAMPSLVTKLFALPKMKKFTFNVSLIYDEKEAAILNRRKGKVTVISLKDNTVQSITFVDAKNLNEVLP